MTESMPVVSVVVPVYRAEKTLGRCVDSLLAQTLPDIELLLVDDGSPDGSGAVCDAYAARDRRIRVLHRENGGASAARNAGVDAAQGRYVGFVDADDYVAPAMYEKLCAAAESTGADAAACGLFRSGDGAAVPELFPADTPALTEGEDIRRRWLLPLFGGDLRSGSGSAEGFSCRLLFRRERLETPCFPDGLAFSEDVFFLIAFYSRAFRIALVNEPLYYYCYNPASLTNRYRAGLWDDIREVLRRLRETADVMGLGEEARRRLDHKALRLALYACLLICGAEPALPRRDGVAAIRRICDDPCVRGAVSRPQNSCDAAKYQIFALLIRLRACSALYGLFRRRGA